MLELVRTHSEVVRCFARPEVLDRLPEVPGRSAFRIATDEVMLVGSGGRVDHPDVLVVDEPGGWTALTLAGADRLEAFARLSAVRPEPGLIQGAIGGAPAKAIVRDGAIHLLVPASYGDHLEARIRASCGDLLPSERVEP